MVSVDDAVAVTYDDAAVPSHYTPSAAAADGCFDIGHAAADVVGAE